MDPRELAKRVFLTMAVSIILLAILAIVATMAHATSDVRLRDKSVSGYTAAVSSTGALTINEQAFTTIYNGHKTITTAGTQLALAASTTVKSVSIKALSTNTGLAYIGNSTVSSTDGYELSAGEAIDLDVNNLASVYVDVSVNGEGVSYIAGN